MVKKLENILLIILAVLSAAGFVLAVRGDKAGFPRDFSAGFDAATVEAVGGMPWSDGGRITMVRQPCVWDTPCQTGTCPPCTVSCPLVSSMYGPACTGYIEIDTTGVKGTYFIAAPLAFANYKGSPYPAPGMNFLAGGASNVLPWVIGLSGAPAPSYVPKPPGSLPQIRDQQDQQQSGECFADTYTGVSLAPFVSIYARAAINFRDTAVPGSNLPPIPNPDFVSTNRDELFSYGFTPGASAVARTWSIGSVPGDYKMFIPPGTTEVHINIYSAQGSLNGSVVRFLQPPQGTYCGGDHLCTNGEWDALVWDHDGSGRLDTDEAVNRDFLFRNHDGTAMMFNGIYSAPLERGGWLYLHVIAAEFPSEPCDPFGGPCPLEYYWPNSVQISTYVDHPTYPDWYNNEAVWDANGDPLPILGPVPEDCGGGGECMADGYTGPPADDYTSMYSLNGRASDSAEQPCENNPAELMTDYFGWSRFEPDGTPDLSPTFRGGYDAWRGEGCQSIYIGDALGALDKFRFYIPPGVTRLTIYLYGPESPTSNISTVARFLRPPDFSDNSVSTEEYNAIVWSNPVDSPPRLMDMIGQDAFIQQYGGHATVVDQYFMQNREIAPLEYGGWLYFDIMNIYPRSSAISAMQIAMEVDNTVYSAWYNSTDRSTGDPVPLIGRSTDVCD